MPELGFFVLWMSFYIWGWQINMLDDYSFHTDFPTDFELISTKNRLKWHGRKIFVAMGALVINFCAQKSTAQLMALPMHASGLWSSERYGCACHSGHTLRHRSHDLTKSHSSRLACGL